MKKCCLVMAMLYAPYSMAGDVALQISGCVVGQMVHVAIYPPSPDFPNHGAMQQQDIQAGAETITMKFANLPSGRYAVAAYLDSNSNQKLDRHWFGPPSERYGFSNNARNKFSAPSFEQAAFEVGTNPVLQSISLH